MSVLLDAPGPRCALVVEVPEAEPVVGSYRARLDPSAADGMPAHVTVLWPWLPAGAVDEPTRRDLADVVRRVPATEVGFRALARFPSVLFLAPEPPDVFVALTDAVASRWPECPPYEGRYDEVVPHLTVADGVDEDVMAEAVTGVAPALPVATRVAAVSLMVRDAAGRWRRDAAYPLG